MRRDTTEFSSLQGPLHFNNLTSLSHPDSNLPPNHLFCSSPSSSLLIWPVELHMSFSASLSVRVQNSRSSSNENMRLRNEISRMLSRPKKIHENSDLVSKFYLGQPFLCIRLYNTDKLSEFLFSCSNSPSFLDHWSCYAIIEPIIDVFFWNYSK